MSKILSIEIDNKKIKVVEGSKSMKGERVYINKCFSLNTPINSIEDGKLINLESIRIAIKGALLENEIKTKKAVFVISANAVITRNIKLPFLKRKSEIMSMIKLEFEQLLSTKSDQIIFFKRANVLNSGCVNKSRYLVYVLPLSVYNRYMELSKLLNLKIISLTISSNCLEKIPEKNLKINENNYFNGSTVFANIGYDAIEFCVIKNGVNDFSRVSYLNPDREEIYIIDRVCEGVSDEYLNAEIRAKKFDENWWLDEIRKCIRYYYSIDKVNIIDKIYIYGTCPEIEGLDCFLTTNLNIDVENIKQISNFSFNYLSHDFNIIEYFHVCLSLLINRNDVNFLDEEIHNHKFKLDVSIAIMTASLIIVSILAAKTKTYLISNEFHNNEISTMKLFINNDENITKNNRIEDIKNEVDFLEAYKQEAIKVKEIIKQEDIVFSQIFIKISDAIPSDTIVKSIIIGENNIQLQCETNWVKDISLFLKNLRNINYICNVHIPSVKYNGLAETNYSYSVICKLEDVLSDENK